MLLKKFPVLLLMSSLSFGCKENASVTSNSSTAYSLTYDGNGSNSGSVPTAAMYNSGAAAVLATVGTLGFTGKSFVGWNTAADGAGTDYAAGANFTMPAATVTLYAKWVTSYVITLNGNGHTSGTVPSEEIILDGEAFTIPSGSAISKTGTNEYEFFGWNTTSDGTGTMYEVGTVINPVADLTLYAFWYRILYVSPTGNDSTGNGTKATPYLTIGAAISNAGTSEEIRVAHGTYTLTVGLGLKNLMRLRGGYDATSWVQDLTSYQTQVISTATTRRFECNTQPNGILFEGFKFTITLATSSVLPIFVTDCPKFQAKHNWIVSTNTNGYAYGMTVLGSSFSGLIDGNRFEVSGTRGAIGIALAAGAIDVDVRNNVIHTVYNSPLNENPHGILVGGVSSTKTLRVRNNTINIGRRSSQTIAAVGEESTSDLGTINLYFDNNIVLGGFAVAGGYTMTGIRQGANTTWNIESLKNNNFFRLDSIFISDKNSQNFTTVSEAETGLGSKATNNVTIEMINAGYFTDVSTKNYTLTVTAPSSITEAALDGDNLDWGFTKDLLAISRTGNGSTGWSMGAYEKN